MKDKTAKTVEGVLSTSTKWMSVSEIYDLIPTVNPATIARVLRKDQRIYKNGKSIPGIYKCEKVPGDRYGRKQWALRGADTTGWADAVPTRFNALRHPILRKVKKQKVAALVKVTLFPPNATYGGFDLMCSPANKPTLVKAVGDLVTGEFVHAQKKFTAYDVTKRLRDIVELAGPQGPIDIAETGTVFHKGHSVARIDHVDVKGIVHDLFNAGAITGFGRSHNPAGYWDYDLAANVQAVDPSVAVAAAVPTPNTTAPDPGVAGAAYDGSSTI